MITRNILFSLGLAGLIIGAAAGGALDLYPEGVAARLTGVLMGVIVIIYANAMPKTFPGAKLAAERSPRWRGVRLFSAWSLILGGAGFIIAWLVAPLDLAPYIAIIPLVIGVAGMAARFLIGPAAAKE